MTPVARAERHREAARGRMKALHADPEFNPLAALTAAQRADYDVLVKKGSFRRTEALRSVGRGDLIRREAE